MVAPEMAQGFERHVQPDLVAATRTSATEVAGTAVALVGATVKHLRVGGVETLPTPVPPTAEQHRIVAKVDQLMALVDELEIQLAAAHTGGADLLEALVAELTATPDMRAMKLRRLQIDGYKNIRGCDIEFTAPHLIHAVIGSNGSGKSNLIEAILQILIGFYFAAAVPAAAVPATSVTLRSPCGHGTPGRWPGRVPAGDQLPTQYKCRPVRTRRHSSTRAVA